MKQNPISIPILLIGFNRPDTISKVLGSIRKAKPNKLYVAVDGPRLNKEGETQLVDEVKKIVSNIDWDCECKYKFNDVNQGAEITISSSISWAMTNEEYLIIMEDDVIAPRSFFEFLEIMLIKYKNSPGIAMVSGCNYTPMKTPKGIDYFFAKNGHTWGWGTWKKVWNDFDIHMQIDANDLDLRFLISRCSNIFEAIYLRMRFCKLKNNDRGLNNWDYMFSYYRTRKGMLSIIPRVNLTSNIGTQGLHYNERCDEHFLPVDENFVVHKHPTTIEWYKQYDIYHFIKHILIPTVKRKLFKN